ncbi:hypothetical protein RGQ29_032875 [Quercus rubra]|uniref:Gag-pol polyprotein n=1 Tax=Quercus rubra TaxID=3512 RepID=A0AAN7DUG5_QUERU|nr:hypothetical protein RGQ29_032875 [Quercus rubra]
MKIAYEIWNGKKPRLKYFRVFGSKCYILNDRENLRKFDAKTKVEMVDDGERASTKEPTVEVEALDIEVEGSASKEESTPMNPRMETRSLSRTSSPLTPSESIIGSLLYLTASKPDIAFSVGVCARYQAAPKESHLTAVKRIITYVNGTPDYGLWYSNDSNACLVGYLDADWAGSVDDRKSTSVEVEYIAAGSCCTQLLWMKKLLHDYGILQNTMCVFCDNTSAINLSKNPIQHSKSKHIEIRYHFIQDLVEDKVVCLKFIHTDNQKADIFTKPLDGPRFESLRKTIGVGTIP